MSDADFVGGDRAVTGAAETTFATYQLKAIWKVGWAIVWVWVAADLVAGWRGQDGMPLFLRILLVLILAMVVRGHLREAAKTWNAGRGDRFGPIIEQIDD